MFYENFKEICRIHGTTATAVCKILGISAGMTSHWKHGQEPSVNHLYKIAKYFNVEVEDILNGTFPKNTSAEFEGFSAVANQNMYLAPIFESVSAGFGTLANPTPIGYQACVCLTKEEAENTLFLRVQGDSMAPKIEDGDLVQVTRTESVDSGSIAVVLIDGEEGVVKKVVYDANSIELHSLNPYYPPRRFEGREVLKCRVVGIVRMILKRP